MCEVCGKPHLNIALGVSDERTEEIQELILGEMRKHREAIPSVILEFAIVEFSDRVELAIAAYSIGKTFEKLKNALVISY